MGRYLQRMTRFGVRSVSVNDPGKAYALFYKDLVGNSDTYEHITPGDSDEE